MQKQRIAGCWIYANGYTLNIYNCIYVSKKRVAGNRITPFQPHVLFYYTFSF